MNHKKKLSGLYPPVVTPFCKDQRVDHAALAHNIEKMNPTGLIGYMPLGSNGEFCSLSDEESLDVIKTVMLHAHPKKIIMAGAGRESAYHTAEFIKALAQQGVHYASVLTPSYFVSKIDDDALYSYFTYVADHSPLPIVLYCAPKFVAGIEISPELTARLMVHPNIVGMKDTSGGDIARYCNVVPENTDFAIMAGSIETYLDGLLKGAVGGVLSPLNYIPEVCCKVEALFLECKIKEATALSDQLRSLNKRTAGKYGVAGVKGAMELLGYRGGCLRNPLFELGSQELDAMRLEFEKEGIL